jgi:hypothetical protein
MNAVLTLKHENHPKAKTIRYAITRFYEKKRKAHCRINEQVTATLIVGILPLISPYFDSNKLPQTAPMK